MAPPKQRLPPGDPNALGTTTDIDRRKCRRVVPLEVLALGLSRTGTCSLRQALLDLGYQDCYHYAACLNENPRDAELWCEALKAKYEGIGKAFEKADWDQLFGHCMAITDTPSVAFYSELLEAYPDAKVILTLRDSTEQWYQSQMNTVMAYFEQFVRPPTGIAGRIYTFFAPRSAVTEMNELLLKHYMYKDLPSNGRRFYEEHNAQIQRIVPKEKLLVFNVKQGWEPLAGFLGKEVPGHPFPRVNDTLTFQSNAQKFKKIWDGIVLANAAQVIAKALGPVVAVLIGVYVMMR